MKVLLISGACHEVESETDFRLRIFYDANQGKTVKGLEISGLALIDLDHVILKEKADHLVVDGFYAKKKFINGAFDLKLDVITKLRSDCNLKYLAEVSDTKVLRRGAPKKYDGKFTIFDLSRFEKKKSIIKD